MRSGVHLESFRGVPYFSEAIHLPPGDAGIHKTIAKMRQLLMGPEGQSSPTVRGVTLEVVRGSVRNLNEIDFVFQWVKQHIDFRGEADETLQSPKVTLDYAAGDCDDISLLLAAMLGSIGYDVRFSTVAVAHDDPLQFSHVYAEVRYKQTGQWIPLDTTVSESYPGWQPSDITRKSMYHMKPLGAVRRRPRLLRGLGDDQGEVLIANPADTSNITGTQAEVYNLVAPFAQAGAALLQSPATQAQAQIQANALAAQSSSLTWVLILGAVGVVAFIAFSGRR